MIIIVEIKKYIYIESLKGNTLWDNGNINYLHFIWFLILPQFSFMIILSAVNWGNHNREGPGRFTPYSVFSCISESSWWDSE